MNTDKVDKVALDYSKLFNNVKGADVQGAIQANNDDEKKKEKFTIAFNGATGYVNPPANNIFGFGPASNNDTEVS